MPYIPEHRRDYAMASPENVGELTYKLYVVVLRYLHNKGETFARLGEVCWALDSAKREVERLIVNPYEDRKRLENGDVFQEDGDIIG